MEAVHVHYSSYYIVMMNCIQQGPVRMTRVRRDVPLAGRPGRAQGRCERYVCAVPMAVRWVRGSATGWLDHVGIGKLDWRLPLMPYVQALTMRYALI